MAKKKIDEVTKPTRAAYEERLEKARELVAESKKKGGPLKFATEMPAITYISSGIEALDRLTGTYAGSRGEEVYTGHGGLPRGRYVVIWGSEQVGKSTLIYRFITKAQQQGLLCMLIDGENRATAPWLRQQGVDLETLIWHQGGIMEDGLQDLINMLQVADFVVIDTVHSLVPQAEVKTPEGAERQMSNDTPMGRQAERLSKFFRVATARVAKAGVAVVLVGQARDVIGAKTPMVNLVGGNALRHYATLRLKISKIRDKDKVPIKKITTPDGQVIDVPVGFLQKITLEKAGTNHLEGCSVSIPFLYGLGPDDFESNIMAAVAAGVIKNPSTGWYEVPTSSGDPVKVHGREALMEFFRKDMSFYSWVMSCITKTEEEGE